MVQSTTKFLDNIHIYIPTERKLDHSYFLNEKDRISYSENGYVVIENVIPDNALNIIEETYRSISKMPGFYEADSFIASPNYGKDIQHFVQKSLSRVNNIVLPKIFDLEKIEYNILNILVLKFNKTNNLLFPHQDAPILDESEAATTFLWIPTCDINEKNGSMLVLPGSHKWAFWQRTHNQHESPLKNNRQTVLKKMKPVYLKKGDVLLFDSALVHASSPNTSTEVRIAMNTGIIPKGYDLIHYLKDEKTPKGKIMKYKIDIDFWTNANYIDAHNIPSKYDPPKLEKLICNYQINKLNLRYLIKKYSKL